MTNEQQLAQAADMLAAYTKAEAAVLSGKSYSIAGRDVTRENLAEIRAGRQEWELKYKRLSTGRTGPRVRRALINDM